MCWRQTLLPLEFRKAILGLGLLWICLLSSCSTENRQSTAIAPPPTADVKKRAEIGIEFLSKAIRRSPSVSVNYQKRAELYMEQRNWPKALEDINEALERSPSNGSYLLTRARVLRQMKRYQEAVADALRAEVLQQSTPELYILLGDLTQQQRQFQRAKLYLAKALQMAPYDGEAYFYQGLLTARQGDTLGGIALMQRALELKPRFAPAYVELTSIHTRLREFDQARLYNDQGLRYFPKESSLHYSRGVMYHTKKRLDSALISYRKTVIFDSTYYLADFQAGTIYLKWNSLPQAVKSFEKTLRYNPKMPQVNFMLGTAYDRLGNLEKAIEQYDLAAKINPGDWKAKGRLYRAQQRKSYFDTYGYLPPVVAKTTEDTEEEIAPTPEKTLDDRVKIEVLTPRLEIKTKTDTSRRNIKIKQ